jgi:hypothetical protein
MLLDGIQSVAATVARASLVVWMVFFSAFDAIAGIAVGVLTRYANSLAGEQREAVIGAIDFLFQDSKFAGGNNFSLLGGLGQLGRTRPRRDCGALAGGRLAPHRPSHASLFPPRYPRWLHGSSRADRPLRSRASHVPSAAWPARSGAAPCLAGRGPQGRPRTTLPTPRAIRGPRALRSGGCTAT